MMHRVETEQTDVLIIGSGAAGLRAAIELSDAKVDVLVLGKCKQREAHTKWAQGGINAAIGTMDSEDSWQQHAADTIKDGGEINNPKAVELLCKNAPDAIFELDEWGTEFAKEEDGRITQRYFGAAKYRRACFVGAHTGLAILNTLVDQTLKRKMRFESEIYVCKLLTHDEVVNGALGIDLKTGDIRAIQAKIIVLATGGHSRMFSRSSSHFWENNGDGIRLATELGASCMDMELFQFHPTGMVHPPEVEGTLATEAIRGEGGILTNAKGERFMENVDRERMELSARDVVARANWKEIEEGRGTEHGGVWLDISHKPKKYILERLPDMYVQFMENGGIDISKEKMEVAPTAHYSMGGLLIEHETGKVLRHKEGPIPNLYAVGEIGSGVHGGNRLGGNSLAEVMVFGKLTGQAIAKALPTIEEIPLKEDKILKYELPAHSEKGRDPIETKKEIQTIMWSAAGVIREKKSMQKGLDDLQQFQNLEFNIGKDFTRNEKLIAALDVLNMLPTCEMILQSALMREESRAAHARSDFPDTHDEWKKNIICTPGESGIELTTKEIPEIPEEIAHLMGDEEYELHLLE